LAARESYPTMLTLGINEQSTAVFNSLKWKSLGGIHRYQKLLFPGEVIREARNFGPLREILNLSFAPFRPRLARDLKRESSVRERSEEHTSELQSRRDLV